jgi:membrane-bound serine protease (ClpP class)
VNDILLIIILILGGLALTVAEICTPTFGVLALSSVACFGLAVYFSFVFDPVLGIVVLVGLVIGLPIFLMYAIRLLPLTPLGRRLALRKLQADTGGGVPTAQDQVGLIGQEGVAASPLRPSGTVVIGDRRLTATAETGFLPAGTRVRVVKSMGLNVMVRPADDRPVGPETATPGQA